MDFQMVKYMDFTLMFMVNIGKHIKHMAEIIWIHGNQILTPSLPVPTRPIMSHPTIPGVGTSAPPVSALESLGTCRLALKWPQSNGFSHEFPLKLGNKLEDNSGSLNL